MYRETLLLALLSLFILVIAGCGSNTESEDNAGAGRALVDNPIARNVMIDKEECCDCTRKRIQLCDRALSAGMAGFDLPVERIHIDSQPEEADEYRAMKSFMVLPALYFLDEDNNVVQMLQGEGCFHRFPPRFSRQTGCHNISTIHQSDLARQKKFGPLSGHENVS